MSVRKRVYTKEFKFNVVTEIESGIKTRAQITREYELSEGLVSKWVQTYRNNPKEAFSGNTSELQRLKSQISQLESALGRKTLEVDILKKALDLAQVKRGLCVN